MGYWDKNKLLNAYNGESCGENSLLYTYLYYVINGRDFDTYVKISYAILNSRKSKGIYKQHPTNEDYMSHDQLTAIFCFNYINGFKTYNNNIWKEIKQQGFKYDNINPENPKTSRMLHPRDIIYYGYLNGSFICKLFSFLLICIMYFSLRSERESTSSKILWYLRIHALENTWLKRKLSSLYLKKMKKMYGKAYLRVIMSIYFKEKEHPINKLFR